MFAVTLLTPGLRAASAAIHFDISSQPMTGALLEFAQQAGISVLFPSGNLNEARANRLSGDYTIEAALDILFAGTLLEAELSADGRQLVIRALSDTVAAVSADADSTAQTGVGGQEDEQGTFGQSPRTDIQGKPEREVEEITVTGSRIRRQVGFDSAVPLTTLERDELFLFEPGLGFAQQLSALPQFFGNISGDDIAGRVGADVGQSQLNMRGMGAARTLVLLDGSRIVPSDRRSSVNVDYLPSTLIRRVDIVTGGASAAYGADALAGVTNFVLDRDFTGLEFLARAGINAAGDGENTRLALTWGQALNERLHVFGSIENRVNREFRRGREDPYEVDWDKFDGYVLNPEWSQWRAANPAAPAGTAPVPQRLTKPYVTATGYTATGLIRQPGFVFNRYMFNETGTGVQTFEQCNFVSWPGAPGTQQSMACQPGAYQYDLFRRGRYIEDRVRLGVDQQTGFLGFDLDLSGDFTLWGHALYGRTKSTSPPTQTAQHEGVSHLTVFRDNYFLPESVRQAMVAEGRDSIRVDQNGFSMTDWGYQERPVVTNYMYSATTGIDAALVDDWRLRASYQYGFAKKHSVLNNWERNDRFFMAHDAVADPERPDTPICRIQLVAREFARQQRDFEAELHAWAQRNTSVYRTDGEVSPVYPVPLAYPFAVDSIDGSISACVPVNMFGIGNQSRAAMDYIFSGRNKTADSVQQQHFAEALATGTLHQGWGAGPVSGALGATYRQQEIRQKVKDVAIDVLGPPFNVTLDDGTVVMRGIPPQIQGGSANLHRFSSQPSFQGSFNVHEIFAETVVPLLATAGDTQKLEVSLAGRYANYSRAGEIAVWKIGFSAKLSEALRLRATWSHDIREGTFEELFVQQGGGGTISDPQNNDISYMISSIAGGNPEIEAEQADTRVLGLVFQPPWLAGLQFSIDRYEVDLGSAIGNFEIQEIIDQCYYTGILCERIDRDSDGLITLVRRTYVNINAARVSGWDGELFWHLSPDLVAGRNEQFSFRLIGGLMDENSNTPLNGTSTDYAGSALLPDKVLTSIVDYRVGSLGLTLMHNWHGSTVRDVTWVEGVDVDDNSLPAWHVSNLGLYWRNPAVARPWTLSFNVNNLFDRPPVVGGITTAGDEIGRRFSLAFETGF